jgi:hypothetical protein
MRQYRCIYLLHSYYAAEMQKTEYFSSASFDTIKSQKDEPLMGIEPGY